MMFIARSCRAAGWSAETLAASTNVLAISASADHAGLLLALRLGLARHGVLQSDRDRDVTDLHRPNRHAPIGCLLSNNLAQVVVSRPAIRQQRREHGGADHLAQRGL